MSSITSSVEQLTQAHLRNVQQLAVFYTGWESVYAINIAKIKAFIITSEIDISHTPTQNDIVTGIATIRGEPITLINLDIWIGQKPLELKDYKLIIFCEFNDHQIGFLVKDVINIVEKTTEELSKNEDKNPKITYTTYVEVKGTSKLCTVFNAEQLLVDIGWTDTGEEQLAKHITKKVNNKNKIFVAEDSKVAREVLIAFLTKIDANFEVFENGTDLLTRLDHIDESTVGVIITDIEMPDTDGYQVAKYIKNSSKLSHIPVIVNSSMTTRAVRDKMSAIGVDDFIGKSDIKGLNKAVFDYLGER